MVPVLNTLLGNRGASNAAAVASAVAAAEQPASADAVDDSIGTISSLCSRDLIRKQDRDGLAIRLYNSLKAIEESDDNRIKDFGDLTAHDVRNDNVVMILNDHVRRIRNKGMVPAGWHLPNGWYQENPTALSNDYVMKIVEPLFAILQGAFSDHRNLQGGQKNRPSWWLETKKNLRSGLDKQRIRGEHEEFDPKTAPLYIINNPMLSRFKPKRKGYTERVDLFHIMQTFIKKSTIYNSELLKIRAQIVISAFAVSRGGEIKWCRFSFWTYDTRFSVIDIGWCELKTSNWYSMPLVNFADPDCFEVDPLHAIACACIADHKILNRYGDDNRDFVFLDLHQIADSSVTNKLGKKLRAHLPEDMPSEVKARYTPKSWRRGGCTRMAWEKWLKFVNAVALSGHKSGSHFETYIDSTGIGLSLPAMMTLTEHKNIFAVPVPPMFESVKGIYRIDQQMKTLIVTKLLPSNLVDFQPSGRLFCALEDMAATLIMSYNKMRTRYYGSNPIVYKMEKLFEDDPNLSLKLLTTMSTQIHDGFTFNNRPVKQITDNDVAKIIDAFNQNSSSNAEVKSSMSSLASLMEDLSLKYDDLCHENRMMRNMLEHNQQQPMYVSSPRKRLRVSNVDNNGSNEELLDVASNLQDNFETAAIENQSLRSKTSTMTPTTATAAVNPRSLNSVLRGMTPMSIQTMRGVTIANALKELHNTNKIKQYVQDDGRFTIDTLNLSYTNNRDKGPYNCCLETVFLSCSQSQLNKLRKVVTVENLDELLEEVSFQALDFLWTLERRSGVMKIRNDQYNVQGFGSRCLKWKKDKAYGSLASKHYHDKTMYQCCVEREFVIPLCNENNGISSEDNNKNNSIDNYDFSSNNNDNNNANNDNTNGDTKPTTSPMRKFMGLFKPKLL